MHKRGIGRGSDKVMKEKETNESGSELELKTGTGDFRDPEEWGGGAREKRNPRKDTR